LRLPRFGPHRLRQPENLRSNASSHRVARREVGGVFQSMRRLLRILVAGSISWAVPAHGAELRIGLAADVTSIDPHFRAIAPNINIAWHVFDALTHVDEDTRPIPGLAVSWRAHDATASA